MRAKRAWEASQRGRPPTWALEDEQDIERQKEKNWQAHRPQNMEALASREGPNVLGTEGLKHLGRLRLSVPASGTHHKECWSVRP